MTHHRRPLASQSGHALLVTMMTAACLLPLGAFAAMQARLDWLVQHHTRATLETFAVADSGLEHALADFDADPRFDRLLAGPDGETGTGDDGEYPFEVAPADVFPRAPFHYTVRVAPQGADAVQITARGNGPLGATRAVVATIVRSAEPFVGAALMLSGREVALALGNEFTVSGLTPSAEDGGLPAVGVPDANAATALAAHLTPGTGDQLIGRGGPPSIAGTAVPSVDAMARAAASRPEAQMLAGEAHGALGEGLFVSPSGARLVDVTGSGVLIANGPLDLSGTSSFSGIVVALGDVRVDLGSRVAVEGAMIVGAMGTSVSLRGAGHVAHDARVIERVDAAYPNLLPRRARVTGWRESFEPPP